MYNIIFYTLYILILKNYFFGRKTIKFLEKHSVWLLSPKFAHLEAILHFLHSDRSFSLVILGGPL